MSDLVGIFVREGCKDVRHYLRSGNILLSASPSLAAAIPSAVARAIKADFGFEAPVILRTADEMVAIAKGHPFPKAKDEERTVHVGFFAERPSASRVASLDAARSPPDTFVVRDKEIFLHLPNGVARTKLTSAYIDKTLGTIVTLRNWRTVVTVAQMAVEA